MKRRELTNEYLSLFCMELSMLLQSGSAPYDCILMLYDDESSSDEKAVLQSLIVNLEKGDYLSTALRESGYFPSYLVIMTEAGEKTGRLTEALQALSAHYDRQERLASSIKSAVLYPSILFALMVGVVLIIIVWVLPVFSGVFNQLGTQMPPLAIALMLFGRWLANFCVAIAVILGASAIAALLAWRSQRVRTHIKNTLQNSFGDRGIFRKITLSRIISVMALATSSGIDPENAIELAAPTGENLKAVEKRREMFLETLRSGSSFSEAMLKSGLLSARNSRLLSVGARSGMTDSALTEIAARCERDTQDEIDRLVGRIEPALVIISSVIVGVILLTVMLPLINIMSSVG